MKSHEQKEALRDQEAPVMHDVRAVRGESLKVEWRGHQAVDKVS